MTGRPAFVFDPDRCTGCEACRIACGIENNEGRDTGWRSVTTFNPARHPALPTRHLSLACNHCDTPACALGCPASAYDRDAATGAVILDPAKCIGCHYCSWVCPYDAPRFDGEHGVMTKCTFCAPRLREAREPACTTACPTDALALGERESSKEHEPIAPAGRRRPAESRPFSPGGEGVPSSRDTDFVGLGDFGLGPSLRVLPSMRMSPPPALAIDGILDDQPSQPLPPRKITAGSEWTLVVFTIVMPALVAWFAGGLARSSRAPSALAFLGLGFFAMALSTAHLGRPLRAWRAVLNVRTSWLSREILFTGLFVALGLPYVALPHAARGLGLPALATGAMLCISIDGVYRAIARSGRWRPHSAEAVLSAALLSGIAAEKLLVTWTAFVLILVLFAGRWRRRALGLPLSLAVTRIVLLLVAAAPVVSWQVAFLAGVVGAGVDRISFYDELEPSSPARRMSEAMASQIPL